MKRRHSRYFVVALALGLVAGLAGRSTWAAIVTNGDLTASSGVPYNGTDNPWATDNLTVGNSAPGSMTIDAGYVVKNNSVGIVASSPAASNSSVTVEGAGSSWTNSNFLNVGYSGTGTLNVTGGGYVSSKGGFVGGGANSNGTVTIGGGTGSSSWTTSSSELTVASAGTGRLNIIGGGDVANSSAYVGAQVGSHGFVQVGGGTGLSSWTNSSRITVGGEGTGTLDIIGGGSVASAGGILGSSGVGTVNVGGGPGLSSWTTSDLVVGNVGTGTLNIIGGGSVSSSFGHISYSSSRACTATVGGGTGASSWTSSIFLDVGFNATLNIKTGGTVITPALNGSSTGTVNFDGGTLRITGTDSASNTINLLAGGGSIDVPTLATTFTITRAISGAGGLTKTGQATLSLNGGNTYTGGTIVTDGMLTISGAAAKLGTGNVSIQSSAAGSALQIQSGVTNAIANTATLSIVDSGLPASGLSAGLAAALVPNRTYVDLGAGINETVNMLLINGVVQGPGTYGSLSSSATFRNGDIFTGSGMITVLIPEATSGSLLFVGLMVLAVRRKSLPR